MKKLLNQSFDPSQVQPSWRLVGRRSMTSTLKKFKRHALSHPEVKAAYDASAEEFAFLDDVLKARVEASLTQAEVRKSAGRSGAHGK